jgi:hypothetical protein
VPETPDRAEATTTALVLAHLELGGLLTGSPSWANAYDARDALERVLDLHDPTWTGRYDSIVEAPVRRTLGDAGIARLKAGAARHFARARELQRFKQQRHLRGVE